MKKEEIKELTNTYLAGTYSRYDIDISYGEGSLLYGSDGRRYIDLCSGIAVNSLGTGNKGWVDAVSAQLNKLVHTSNLYYTEPQARLGEILCSRTGMERIFFSNSGAEANECAIKAARKYSRDKYGEGRHKIITLKGSFHGRTITTLSATGQDLFHTNFDPFTPGFVFTPKGDIEGLEQEIKAGAAAFMIEFIQGESGVTPLDIDFMKKAKSLLEEYDTLLIADEVQTGIGRTGKLFSFEHYGIVPDIITSAKGLGGGLPIGATIFGEKTGETLGFGDHGSTFGGNPLCTVGAINVLEQIDEVFLEDVVRKGEIIKDRLKDSKNITKITGRGLMIGIETKRVAKEIVEECIDKGVLVLTAKEKVRLLPPLNIPDDLLVEAIEILKTVIDS